ncbi:hypothetical protein CPG37_05060 [Malaciobacter canalis]|uniref:Transposase n=1 Tax=Malaciobacter canalis TaxID=1912871 RepID=A0ABX4LR64_9BACT|nr:hypothetical protein CPG37_05060 [Malaciobacter canalis]QEE32528.1 hypothetical protein ACAN_1039 [Malaciobacter canalis]
MQEPINYPADDLLAHFKRRYLFSLTHETICTLRIVLLYALFMSFLEESAYKQGRQQISNCKEVLN